MEFLKYQGHLDPKESSRLLISLALMSPQSQQMLLTFIEKIPTQAHFHEKILQASLVNDASISNFIERKGKETMSNEEFRTNINNIGKGIGNITHDQNSIFKDMVIIKRISNRKTRLFAGKMVFLQNLLAN